MKNLLDAIRNLFIRKTAAEVADKLTDGVVAIFTEADNALEAANELYARAAEEADEEILSLLEAVEDARDERQSIIAAVGANERRRTKLAEFLG